MHVNLHWKALRHGLLVLAISISINWLKYSLHVMLLENIATGITSHEVAVGRKNYLVMNDYILERMTSGCMESVKSFKDITCAMMSQSLGSSLIS